MASSNKSRRIKWKYLAPIIVALIVAVGGIISAIITRPQSQTIIPSSTGILPTPAQSVATSSSPASPSTASPGPSSTLTSTPTHIVLSSQPFTVPTNTQNGVAFIAPTNGMYQIKFIGGAYTTYEGSSWVSNIVIYKNKPIQWSNTPQPGPTGFDTYIGSGEKEGSEAASIAAAKTQRPTVNFSLQAGDKLLFVAVDVRGEYDDNQGQIFLSIELIQ